MRDARVRLLAGRAILGQGGEDLRRGLRVRWRLPFATGPAEEDAVHSSTRVEMGFRANHIVSRGVVDRAGCHYGGYPRDW